MTWLNQVGGREVGGARESEKQVQHEATSGFGRMGIPLGSFWGWSLFHAVQIKVQHSTVVGPQ